VIGAVIPIGFRPALEFVERYVSISKGRILPFDPSRLSQSGISSRASWSYHQASANYGARPTPGRPLPSVSEVGRKRNRAHGRPPLFSVRPGPAASGMLELNGVLIGGLGPFVASPNSINSFAGLQNSTGIPQDEFFYSSFAHRRRPLPPRGFQKFVMRAQKSLINSSATTKLSNTRGSIYVFIASVTVRLFERESRDCFQPRAIMAC